MNYTDNEIESLLKGIFNGAITVYEIPETLYFAIADYLKRGVYSGFGSNLSTVSSADLELLTSLRENIYMFSAAKSYTELKDMSSLLVQDGKLASWQEFYKEAKHRFDIYNVDYAKTEYRTAVGQAQMAAQWNEIERTKDIIPFLKYSAIMDPNTSTICAPLDGIVAEVSDPIWNTIMPLNHFNCFAKGTKVLTPKGYVNIEDVKEGDLVTGGSGNFHKVTAIHINSFNGELIRIGIKNNSACSTKNHRHLTARGWVQSINIGVGDILIQHENIFGFNKVVRCINNMYVVLCYLLMPIVRQWKSTMINTLDADIKRRDENINKSTVNKFVSYTDNSTFSKHIKNNLLAFSKWCMKLFMPCRIFFVCLYRFIISTFSSFNIKHRVINFHSFALRFIFKSQAWMRNTFNSFLHFITGVNPSLVGVNPLVCDTDRGGFYFKSKFSKYSNKGTTINAPFLANTLHRGSTVNVHGSDGFSSGAPLDSFNSLVGFLIHSFWHNKFNLVCNTVNVQYKGNIYNLSVEQDESYIVNTGIVHNCRCVVTQEYTGEPTKDREQTALGVEGQMQDVFKHNSGKDGMIYPKSHPYFDVPAKDREYAKNNFNLPIPKDDI